MVAPRIIEAVPSVYIQYPNAGVLADDGTEAGFAVTTWPGAPGQGVGTVVSTHNTLDEAVAAAAI